MNLRDELAAIAINLGYLDRDGTGGTGDGQYRFHSENCVRDAIKKEFARAKISLLVQEIDTEVIMPNVTQGGARAYATFVSKSKVIIELTKGAETVIIKTSAANLGDDRSNASSASTTLAIRNWMKAQFQITYDPAEGEVVVDAPPGVEMSAAMEQDAKLMITRAVISNVKKAAKEAGYKPSSWNLNKMTDEDLFRCSAIAMHLVVKSPQAGILDDVAKELGNE